MAQQPPGAQPQWSADGQWWWDGHKWVPAAQAQAQQTETQKSGRSLTPAYAVSGGPTTPLTPKKGNFGRNLGIGCGGLIVFGILAAIISSAASSQSGTPTAAQSSAPATAPAVKASTAPTTAATAKPTAPPAADHILLTVSGTGYLTTQPFKVPTSNWTLAWKVDGDPQFAEASFQVYDSNGSIVTSADAKPGSDSTSVHQGNGIFFIKVLDANAKYALTASAHYAGSDPQPLLGSFGQAAQFQGSGDKDTTTFHISGNIWRVHLQSGGPSEYTSVSVSIMKADGSRVDEVSVEGAQGGTDATTYIYAGAGDYYLHVLDANTTWSATIEQAG